MLNIAYLDPPKRGGKPLRWMLFDSLIVGLIAFVATLPAEGPPSIEELYLALKAFAYAFLVQLAVYRGLRRR